MAKINCSVTVNYLREHERMCKFYDADECVNDCPMSARNNGKKCGCEKIKCEHPETAVEIVQKWSDEHPQKTRLDDLLEKYPNARIDNSPPHFFPYALGYCEDCHNCVLNDRRAHKVCWHEPLDGGATGIK